MTTTIPAHLNKGTKEETEKYDKDQKTKQAMPDDVIIPSHIVVSNDSFNRIEARLTETGQPNEALRDLMRD